MNIKIDFRSLVSLLINSKESGYYKDSIIKDPRTILIEETESEALKEILIKKQNSTSEDFSGAHLLYQIDLTQKNYDILIQNLEVLQLEEVIKNTLVEKKDNAIDVFEYQPNFIGNIALFNLPENTRLIRSIQKTIPFIDDQRNIYREFPLLRIEKIYEEICEKEELYLCIMLQDGLISFILLDKAFYFTLNSSINKLLSDMILNLEKLVSNIEDYTESCQPLLFKIHKQNLIISSDDTERYYLLQNVKNLVEPCIKNSEILDNMIKVEIENYPFLRSWYKPKDVKESFLK